MSEAVVFVIVWKLDLQLPVQSVPITAKGVDSNLAHGDVYSIQKCVERFVSPVSFTNKTTTTDNSLYRKLRVFDPNHHIPLFLS
jgi:hypothetical protein